MAKDVKSLRTDLELHRARYSVSTLRVASALLMLLATSPLSLSAQSRSDSNSPSHLPQYSLEAGLGHSYGFFGVQNQLRFSSHVSAVASGGIGPHSQQFSFAAGLRAQIDAPPHYPFLEGSLLPVYAGRIELTHPSSDGESFRQYGVGLQGGYQYVAPFGLTVEALGGVGYALWGDAPIYPPPRFHALFGLSVGWAWYRDEAGEETARQVGNGSWSWRRGSTREYEALAI